jgi:hypothetical protein
VSLARAVTGLGAPRVVLPAAAALAGWRVATAQVPAARAAGPVLGLTAGLAVRHVLSGWVARAAPAPEQPVGVAGAGWRLNPAAARRALSVRLVHSGVAGPAVVGQPRPILHQNADRTMAYFSAACVGERGDRSAKKVAPNLAAIETLGERRARRASPRYRRWPHRTPGQRRAGTDLT